MPLKIKLISFIITLFTSLTVFSQTEVEMKTRADDFFGKKQYVEATPLYLRLLSLQPRDFDYSYKYGACLLFNSTSKQEAIRYLTYGVKSPTEITDAYFFLGKAYHLNYQFNDAINSYKTYCKNGGIKGQFYEEANRNISMCENGKNLLTNLTDIIVRKKTEIKQSDFFRLYDLSQIGGSLITAVDFQTKMDKKLNHAPIVHLSPSMENVYFSSYGEGNNLDIYVSRKLPGGKFGVPQRLPEPINTPFDEDYPYLHPNGRELYFSSKGHNSMGGYDIFKAKLNADSGQFDEVANVDFSISSPDDDLLYMVDKENKNAYFSSKRQSQDGKVVVYKVGVERFPIQLAIVKGAFTSTILTSNPKMTVSVFDKTNGKKIGNYKNLKDESYLITFPKGGKYLYKIKVEGVTEEFTAEVDIPFLKELRPLKQRMIHERVNEKEVVRIVNLFDEQIEDAQGIIAQVLKDRADLNVNEDQFENATSDQDAQLSSLFVEIGIGNRELHEAGQMLEQTSKLMSNASDAQSLLHEKANGIAQQLYQEIAQIDTEIRSLVKEADASASTRRKELVLENASALFEQREHKQAQINATLEEGNQKETSSVAISPAQIVAFQQVVASYSTLVKEGKEAELLPLLQANKSILKKVMTNNSPTSLSGELLKKQEGMDAELAKLTAIEQGYTDEKLRLEHEITTLKNDLEYAKEKLKPEIASQIEQKQSDLSALKGTIEKVHKTISQASEKRNENNQRLNLVNEIEVYTGTLVSNAQLAQTKASIEESKTQVLKNYVETSLNELHQQHDQPQHDAQLATAMQNYNSLSEQIHTNTTLSVYSKQAELLKINTQKQAELKHQLDALNSVETNEKDEASIAAVQKQLDALALDQEQFKQAQRAAAKEEILKINDLSIVESLHAHYSETKKNLEANNAIDLNEKTEKLNTLDQQLISKIDNATEQLIADPFTESTLKDAKQSAFVALKATLQKDIDKRNNAVLKAQEDFIAQQKALETTIKIKEFEAEAQQMVSELMHQLSNSNLSSTAKIDQLNEVKSKLLEVKEKVEHLTKTNKNVDASAVHSDLESKLSEIEMLVINEQKVMTDAAELERQKNQEAIATTNTQEDTTNDLAANHSPSDVPLPTQKKDATATDTLHTVSNNATNDPTKIDQKTNQKNRTPLIIVEELQALYTGNLKNDLHNPVATKAEIQSVYSCLSNYKTALNQQLANALQNSENSDLEAFKTAVSSEMSVVNQRLEVLQQQQLTLENFEQEQIAKETLQAEKIKRENEAALVKLEAEKLEAERLAIEKRNIEKLEADKLEAQQKEAALRAQQNENPSEDRTSNTPIQVETTQNNPENIVSTHTSDHSAKVREASENTQENEISQTNSEQITTEKQIPVTSTRAEQTQLLNAQLAELVDKKTIDSTFQDQQNQIDKTKNAIHKSYLEDALIAHKQDFIEQENHKQELARDQEISSNYQEIRLYSKDELQQRKRVAVIEIEELTQLQMQVDEHMQNASKKTTASLLEQKRVMEQKMTLAQSELAFVTQQLALIQPFTPAPLISESSVKMSYNEERQIAASELYETYAKIQGEKNEALAAYQQEIAALKSLQNQFKTNQQQKGGTVAQAISSQNQHDLLQQMQEKSVSLKKAERALQQFDAQQNDLLPLEDMDRKKFDNLVARGINPLKKVLVSTALIPISVHGIEFNPTKPVVEALQKIPVGLESPSGLVYRVQVGAFAKPIPEQHFKEFSPVSGEKLEKSNITRYMAGYFNNSTTVVAAREKIRKIGYADAFIVAYCDGKRISFGEARQLEAKNQCIGKQKEELQLEVATTIARHLGLEDTTKTIKPVSEYTYNQLPGAAKATAIEQFDPNQISYSVQIGVFNRPVTSEKLHHLSPLYTIRLDNGQIRYSVGLFGNVSEALEVQKSVREKVADAFVVAYYQGKRISNKEAMELISNGVPTFSASKNPIVATPQTILETPDVLQEVPVFSNLKLAEPIVEKDQTYLQFVSKQQYSNYPQEELKRYNAKGNFYYDPNDQFIKSGLYGTTHALPRISGFAHEMDTLRFSNSEMEQMNLHACVFSLESTQLPGDFQDWLLKVPYRKSYILTESGIEIRIFDIQEKDLEQMKSKAKLFGIPFIGKASQDKGE